MNLKDKFLTPSSDWDSHLPMLWLGLTLTKGRVTELGSGEGSTSLLRQYCQYESRPFFSFDSNKDWAEKTMSRFVPDWDNVELWKEPCELLFVDEAPGEHRIKAISEMVNKVDVIVIHDTEEVGAGDYGYKNIWPLFKFRLNYNRLGPGAGCSIVSNKVDVEQYVGEWNGFLFEVKLK